MKEENFTEKRFLKMFRNERQAKLIDEINSFASKLNGKIVNYSLEKDVKNGEWVAIIFYSEFVPNRH